MAEKTKLLSLIMVCVMFLTGAAGCRQVERTASIYEQSDRKENLVYERKQTLKDRGYLSLTEKDEQDAYANIDITVHNMYSSKFDIPKSIFDNFGNILEIYKNDHPEVFWLKDDVPYSYFNTGDSVTIMLEFKLDGEELVSMQDTFIAKVKAILATAPFDGTDFEKELYVNDYLVDNVTYDKEALELHKDKKIRANEQNAYGALVDGVAVCEGYARAFQLLCMELGIDCAVIEGYADETNDKTKETVRSAHIWNCIYLDGDWYHVDPTWNDDVQGEYADVYTRRYYYLNLTTAEIEVDHVINPLYSEKETTEKSDWYNNFVPECTSDEYNYFNYNCETFTSFKNTDRLVKALAESAKEGKPYFDFLIDKRLNFDKIKKTIAEGTGFAWIKQANEINEHYPEISDQCELFTFKDRRLVTFLLKYY